MDSTFDRRIVPPLALEFTRSCQQVVPCHLGGGLALSGAFLHHRLSRDLDLILHDAEDVRNLARALPDVAADLDAGLDVVRDAGTFVRARLTGSDGAPLEVDLAYEGTPDLEPPVRIESVEVESLADLRASKLTCILSRSEPRDLVDLLFLDRAGHPPERDLPAALRKDAGIDPATLAWLLHGFPVEPLPQMLSPLTAEELDRFRAELAERFRRATVPDG